MCGVTNGKIVIVGGTNWDGGKKNWLKSIRVFDPSAKKWSAAKDLESPLAYGSVLHIKDAFAVLGGFDGNKPSTQFAWVNIEKIELHYDLNQPVSLVLAAGGAVGQTLVVAGGTNDPGNLAGVHRTTYLFKWGKSDPRSGIIYAEHNFRPSEFWLHFSGSFEIIKQSDYPGKPFAVAASAVLGDELLVFGGMNYDEAAKAPVNSSEAYAFLPAKNSWRKLRSLTVANRGLVAVALDEQHIYLAGGYTDNFTAAAFIYDVKADSYRKAKSLPYAAMVGLVKLDGFVYCMGGEDKEQSRTDKFFRIPIAELLKP